ncbi:MAG: kelch repeat-containing protein [Ginsengibacter sp.]
MKRNTHIFKLRFPLILISILISSLLSAQWVRKADGLKPRSELAETVVYNSKLYSFGGFSDSLYHVEPTSEVYNPATNTWTYLASMPLNTAMTHADVILIDNTVWHIGGRVGQNPGTMSSKVWIYNITTNTWSAGPEIRDPATGQPMVIAASGSVLLGRVIHIFGGFTPTGCSNDQDTYHLTLDVDTWLSNPSMPAPWKNNLKPLPLKRNHLSALTLGGKIYAIGGQLDHDCGGKTEVPYCHVYNPSTDSWKQLTSLPTGRSHAEGSTFAIDGKIYIAGGQKGDGTSTSMITVFDPAANNGAGAWNSNAFNLPYIYEGLSATIIGASFIVSHGSQGPSKYSQKLTYTRPIARNPVYKLGFPSECLNLNDSSGNSLKGYTWLYTIDSTKSYTTSSNASWLAVTKNAAGVANQNAVDIAVTADTTGLAPGTYSATITATGTGGGTYYTPATLCVNLTVHQNYQSGAELITNIISTSGGNYILSHLAVDTAIYTDRAYVATSVPVNLNNASFIKTPNNDKANTSATLLSFNINQDAAVYIAYDPRATVLPAWLSGFQKLASQVGINDPKITYLELYSKNYTKGTVSLGGNLQSPAAGALNNYFVIVVPQTAPIQYNLTVSATGNGTVTKNPNQATYANGSAVTLTAIPAAGQQFTGWSGAASGTVNPLTITMDGNKSITAAFAPIQYNLTVAISGNGTVTKNPNQATYASGSAVTLTATPAAGQQFTGWSGAATGSVNPLTITMDANKSITATFATTSVQYTLTLTISGNGTVTKNPNQSNYASGTNVTITATPATGQQFNGWSGNASGTTNPLVITMTTNKNITATFVQIPALVSNITTTTGRQYTLSVLTAGTAVYTDRTTQATTVPSSLNNTSFIKTPNDDKSNKSAVVFSFNISQNATIYIAYDPRGRNLPAWLSGWQKLTGQQVGVNDTKINYMQLYSKSYSAGKVSLGGNLQSPANGSLSNYFVIVQAQQMQRPAANQSYSNPNKSFNDQNIEKPEMPDIENSALKLKLYPNPNPGNKIHINAENFSKNEIVVITLQDALGRVIKSTKAVTNNKGAFNKEIFVPNKIAKGLYIINAVSLIHNVQEKIIIL